jgi:hypothetical protein
MLIGVTGLTFDFSAKVGQRHRLPWGCQAR